MNNTIAKDKKHQMIIKMGEYTMDKRNNILSQVDEGIFSKIKKFIRSIFSNKESSNRDSDIKSEISKNAASNFDVSIKVDEDQMVKKLKKLQRDIDNDNYSYSDLMQLNEEERKKLQEMYNEQIKELEERFAEYKEKILKIKKEVD